MTAPAAFSHEPALVRWLCGSAHDRARFAAMNARLQKVSFLAAPVGAVVILTSRWAGPGLLVTAAVAAVVIIIGTLRQRVSDHPEVPTALIFLVMEMNAGASVLLSGGAHSPLVPLLVAPVCIQGTCLRPRLFLGCCATAAVVAAPSILLASRLDAGSAPPDVVYLCSCLALVIALATSGHVLAAADLVVRDRADVDPLTGLYNRAALDTQFQQLRRRALVSGEAVSLVMLDVDHFKRINDEQGHARGDQVLQELAQRLRGSVRGFDRVYRVGGEEFVVVLPGHDALQAETIAERIRCRVAERPMAELSVTVSLGVATDVGGALDLAQLTAHADGALYAAKAAGRNRVVTHTDDVHDGSIPLAPPVRDTRPATPTPSEVMLP